MTLPLELGGIHDPSIRRAFEQLAQQFPITVTGGGGGGAPSGPAGGDLGSTYPNPTVIKAQSGFTVGGVAVILAGDAALTNARTPTAHHATHEPGGTDAMVVDAAAATGSLRTIGTGALQAAAGNDSRLTNARTPTAHATTHQPGGSDPMAVDAAAATGSLRTLGTGAAQAAAGNDARFTDSRAPNGAAGGDLSGTYPSPQIATGVIVDADVNAAAAIAESKLNLATDAAAGTGSRRTLGTTATSAASGDRGLPTGGTSGQVLAKNSATNYDAGWVAAGGSPATVLTQYTTIMRAATIVPTQGAGGTFLASLFGNIAATATAGTAQWAFYLDPADLNFTGTTNKLRLRSSYHGNAVAIATTMQANLSPVGTWGGASGTAPTIATVNAAILTNAYTTPAANAHIKTDSADINFPTAGWYVFTIGINTLMAAGSQSVFLFELQARQV